MPYYGTIFIMWTSIAEGFYPVSQMPPSTVVGCWGVLVHR